MKINVWLARLQIYLQDYVDPSNWVSHTLMLINSQMTEKLGELKYFSKNKEGFENLKKALIKSKEVGEKFKLSDLTTRKQRNNQSVEDYGRALETYCNGVFSDDTQIQEIFCQGLKNEEIKKKTAHKIIKMKNSDFNFKKLVSYTSGLEQSLDIVGKFQSSDTDNTESTKYPNVQKRYQSDTRYHNASQTGNQNHGNYNQNHGNLKQNQRNHNPNPLIHNQSNSNSQVRFNTDNTIVQAMIYGEEKEKVGGPIKGKIILDNLVVEYLTDSGAEVSIITKRLFNKLKKHFKYLVRKYNGPPLYSCNKPLKVEGIICANKFIVDNIGCLDKVTLVIVEDIFKYECIMGMDLITRIPEYLKYIQGLRETVERKSKEVEKIARESVTPFPLSFTPLVLLSIEESESEATQLKSEQNRLLLEDPEVQAKQAWFSPEDPVTRVELLTESELEAVPTCHIQMLYAEKIFDGFPDSRPLVLEPNEEADRERIRQEIKQDMQSCVAASIKDICPKMNIEMAFKIKLADPIGQKPIRQKARPLAHTIKARVYSQIKEMLETGIIRRSTSDWAAPLQVVHKKDTDELRITVDYKLLNQVIQQDPYPIPKTKDLYSELSKSK